jgi:hypothetical protein
MRKQRFDNAPKRYCLTTDSSRDYLHQFKIRDSVLASSYGVFDVLDLTDEVGGTP